jgi:hypothetical protein
MPLWLLLLLLILLLLLLLNLLSLLHPLLLYLLEPLLFLQLYLALLFHSLLLLLLYLALLIHGTQSRISAPRSSTTRRRGRPRRWRRIERHIDGGSGSRHTHLLAQRPHDLGAYLLGNASHQMGRQLVCGGASVEGMAYGGCGGGDRGGEGHGVWWSRRRWWHRRC